MKISFVGHSHHRVTGSSGFFLALLQQLGTVECIWDETWRGESAADQAPVLEETDLVVVWQSVPYARRLARLGHRNIVYVPMYDASKRLRRSFWSALKDTKILNFSSTLHQRVQALGAPRSAYFQYFPDPATHTPVHDFETLRGFFWQRQERPAWADIRRLLSDGQFQSMHLHQALDPNVRAAPEPSPLDHQSLVLEVTQWLPQRSDLLQRLAASNVYFAPRLDEGIGLAFLEAMAMGMAVCAHDQPTHNEYIVDGVNGFLYRLDEQRQPDWLHAAEMGRRARESVENGHRRWQMDQARLLEFLADPHPSPGVLRFARDCMPTAPPRTIGPGPEPPRANGPRPRREGGRRLIRPASRSAPPLLTIATVVRDAPDELALTLNSILAQSGVATEVLVIDGASADATQRVIETYDTRLDYWLSEPDGGPYDAMNKAADIATGHWILYINAGDCLVDSEALARVLAQAPPDSDFIAAHHVYIGPDGSEAIHRCANFNHTYQCLLDGSTDGTWLSGIPGHQALLTRVDLIRRHRYDLSFRIAADHEFLFRMRALGASVHIAPMILSQYVGGGLSWQQLFACLAEWRRIAIRASSHPERVARHFQRLTANTVRHVRRIGPFDWHREPARSHPWMALAAEAEFRLRSLIDRADSVYATLRPD